MRAHRDQNFPSKIGIDLPWLRTTNWLSKTQTSPKNNSKSKHSPEKIFEQPIWVPLVTTAAEAADAAATTTDSHQNRRMSNFNVNHFLRSKLWSLSHHPTSSTKQPQLRRQRAVRNQPQRTSAVVVMTMRWQPAQWCVSIRVWCAADGDGSPEHFDEQQLYGILWFLEKYGQFDCHCFNSSKKLPCLGYAAYGLVDLWTYFLAIKFFMD